MNIKRTIIVLLLPLIIVGIGTASYGEEVNKITRRFVSGKSYTESTEEAKKAWLLGVVGGILAESVDVVGNNTSTLKQANDILWFAKCLDRKKLHALQIKVIFEEYLISIPEEWKEPASGLFLFKFRDLCEKN